MKKLIVGMVAASLILTGCGAPKEITIEGKTKEYPTYGFFNAGSSKSDKVCYELSVGNVVWSILLIEGILFPVYFIGFSLFNPVSAKSNDGKCGVDQY